jgi:two-component system OmpR family sensor kinase
VTGPEPASPAGPVTPAEPADNAESRSAGWWWHHLSLRVKLVAAVLALVAFALIIIGVGSVVALRYYMVDRVDSQLTLATASLRADPLVETTSESSFVPPSDFLVAMEFRPPIVEVRYFKRSYRDTDIPDMPAAIDAGRAKQGEAFTVASVNHRRQWRVMVGQTADGRMFAVGEDLSGVDNAVAQLIFINLLVGLAVLVTLAAVGVWVVRMNLRPLVEMERTAAAIARGDLTQRVPELDPNTELGQLSAALNTMLTQIETAFHARAASEGRAVNSEERMRQFVADASHELRTPLTTIRGFAELYRQGAAPDPGEVLRRIEDEAARMGLLVEDLLLLARLDRERPLRHAPVALADLIRDAAAGAHAVAPDREITVDVAPDAENLTVDGDEERLRQVVDNLVTNAIIHNPSDVEVALGLAVDDSHAVIEVKDTGTGLTPEHAARVFERFYRVDKARARRAASSTAPGRRTGHHSGAGLGLAIVAALVAAHNGTVEVDTAPGEGATFRVRLPLTPPNPTAPTSGAPTSGPPASQTPDVSGRDAVTSEPR